MQLEIGDRVQVKNQTCFMLLEIGDRVQVKNQTRFMQPEIEDRVQVKIRLVLCNLKQKTEYRGEKSDQFYATRKRRQSKAKIRLVFATRNGRQITREKSDQFYATRNRRLNMTTNQTSFCNQKQKSQFRWEIRLDLCYQKKETE